MNKILYEVIRLLIDSLMAYFFAVMLCIPLINALFLRSLMKDSKWFSKWRKQHEIN